MPQINPINWLILFLYFSRVLVGCVAKLHFLKLRNRESMAEVKMAKEVEKFPVCV